MSENNPTSEAEEARAHPVTLSPCHLVTLSRLFLVGPRGSGKSTVAALLARRLGWGWVDADALLEERAGRTIRDLFAEEGEPGFREREASLLAELCGRARHVIATGGGVVLRPASREAMRRAGV